MTVKFFCDASEPRTCYLEPNVKVNTNGEARTGKLE
jgi:hypothetical protein